MKVGFTASQRGLTASQKETLYITLYNLRGDISIAEFHHGNCIGGDEQGAQIAYDLLNYEVTAHPGDNPAKQSKGEWWHYILDPKPNLERNKDIVTVSDVLVACPHTTKEILRSGTWATIREARDRQEKPVEIIWHDGRITRYN